MTVPIIGHLSTYCIAWNADLACCTYFVTGTRLSVTGVSGGWGGVFAGINASHPGGVAYMQSVIDLWVQWGVDAIEADDYMGGSSKSGGPNAHPYDCCAYPYLSEIDLLASAIAKSANPKMVLSIMPGDGSVPADGVAVAALPHKPTTYRVTADFHADNGGSGTCANPAGCWGAPGGDIVLANCNLSDKGQVWQWTQGAVVGQGFFIMPFSAGKMTLSCRNDVDNHTCQSGDDLDLWYNSKTPNQVLDATLIPSDSKPGTLKFQRHTPSTCVSADAGNLLRMEDCSTTTETQSQQQQWKALPSTLSPGSVRLQSVADPTKCILGKGKSHANGHNNARWPPQQQFYQAATFAHLIGANDTWVNLDDLPMGHMTLQGCKAQTLGPCVWSEPQQRSVFTLYCMVRSPIMSVMPLRINLFC